MFAFRFATADDADEIARIISLTSAGMVTHLLKGLVPGMTAETILSTAFMKEEGAYSPENVVLSMKGDNVAALLFSYPASYHCVPPLMESFVPRKRLNAVRPILERSVADSLYINTVWLDEAVRGGNYGDAVMMEADSRCRSLGLDRISLFCWNDDDRAMHFYARHGFGIVEHLSPETLPLEGRDKGGAILCRILSGA